MIPNISIEAMDTLQFLARFSEILLEYPNDEETRRMVSELIEKANKIILEFYQIQMETK
jgi:hypothetical protein